MMAPIDTEQTETRPAPSTMRVAGHLGQRSVRLQGIRESAFRDAVVQHARYRGWVVYWTWNSKHSPAGYPDLTMVRGNRLIFAELKTAVGRVGVHQQEWLDALSQVPGVETYLWRPDDWPEIERILA